MLVILAIAGTTLTTILYSLMKNAGKKDELEDLLADESEEEGEGWEGWEGWEEPVKGEDKPRQPWEKDGDWWKG